jgi:hypothetical protein
LHGVYGTDESVPLSKTEFFSILFSPLIFSASSSAHLFIVTAAKARCYSERATEWIVLLRGGMETEAGPSLRSG